MSYTNVPNFRLYPDRNSIGPYLPFYRDNTSLQQGNGLSRANYTLQQYSGKGNFKFNIGSLLPVSSAILDSGFSFAGSNDNYPIQFNGTKDYDNVANFLLNSSYNLPQGIPYNLFVRDQGELYQLGSQVFNVLAPIKINEAYQPQQNPALGLYGYPMAFGGGMPNPYAAFGI